MATDSITHTLREVAMIKKIHRKICHKVTKILFGGKMAKIASLQRCPYLTIMNDQDEMAWKQRV